MQPAPGWGLMAVIGCGNRFICVMREAGQCREIAGSIINMYCVRYGFRYRIYSGNHVFMERVKKQKG